MTNEILNEQYKIASDINKELYEEHVGKFGRLYDDFRDAPKSRLLLSVPNRFNCDEEDGILLDTVDIGVLVVKSAFNYVNEYIDNDPISDILNKIFDTLLKNHPELYRKDQGYSTLTHISKLFFKNGLYTPLGYDEYNADTMLKIFDSENITYRGNWTCGFWDYDIGFNFLKIETTPDSFEHYISLCMKPIARVVNLDKNISEDDLHKFDMALKPRWYHINDPESFINNLEKYTINIADEVFTEDDFKNNNNLFPLIGLPINRRFFNTLNGVCEGMSADNVYLDGGRISYDFFSDDCNSITLTHRLKQKEEENVYMM